MNTLSKTLSALSLSGLLLFLPVAQADPAEGSFYTETTCEYVGWAFEIVLTKYRYTGGQWTVISQLTSYADSCPPLD
ncbi:hypothetical protein [Pseudomonas sp. CGJS7]|uniref:hypothetical protein n=1 Tax=Pseudomonas sp. CGJS7 TaxID=3109348 RepID=UPI003009AD1C